MTEVWTEIRCPSCVPCGWETSRLLLRVYGKLLPQEAKIQTKCHRCKSLISWRIGTPDLRIDQCGPKNRKRQYVSFE